MNHKHYYCPGHEETQYTSNDTTRATTGYIVKYIKRANKSYVEQSGKTQMTLFTMVNSLVICILIMQTAVSNVSAQQSPSISFISKEQVVEIGDRLVLKCITQYATDYPVHWIHFNRETRQSTLISNSNSKVIQNSRYQVLIEGPNYGSAEKSYTLIIDKVQEIDSGTYSCQLITGIHNNIRFETEVLVRIPPIISDNSTRSVITSSGSDVELYCYGIGYPKPQISWRREKNKLIPGYGALVRGNKLTIQNVSRDARGTFYCVADNGVSSGSRRSISVEIEFAPVVRAERSRYGQALQYTAILTCHIESFPSPSIEWLKDGRTISDNKNYKISLFATSDEFVETSLTVLKIEKKHYGNYTCKASNKLGPGHQEIELFETVNIVCPPSCVGQFIPSSGYSYKLDMLNLPLIIISSILLAISSTCL